jgi:hypothetical protein
MSKIRTSQTLGLTLATASTNGFGHSSCPFQFYYGSECKQDKHDLLLQEIVHVAIPDETKYRTPLPNTKFLA